MNFWETKEWISLKTTVLKTDKLLSRIEYLKQMGYKNFTEEKYQQYIKVMSEK